MKKHTLLFLGLAFYFIINATSLWGQNFPVSVTVQLLPPHHPVLTNYTSGGLDKMNLTVLLLDANEFNYPVKFRFKIDGPGISIRTDPDFQPPPVTLDFGIPQNLSGSYFVEYFDPDNLIFQGLDKSVYIQNGGRLPDGLYTICVETYDYIRDETPVSNLTCQVVNLIEHHPPVLITPIGFQDNVTYPQSLLFTWQPMHIQNFLANYEVSIYELVNDFSDDQIVNFTPPIYTYSTPATSFVYGPTAPQLTRSKEYVWRVQATSVLGDQAFKNDGFSEVGHFIYDNRILGAPVVTGPTGNLDCLYPQDLNIDWISTHGEDIPVEYEVFVYSEEPPPPPPPGEYEYEVVPAQIGFGGKDGPGVGPGKGDGNNSSSTPPAQSQSQPPSQSQTPPAPPQNSPPPQQQNNTPPAQQQQSNSAKQTNPNAPGNTSPVSPVGQGDGKGDGMGGPPMPNVEDLYLIYSTTTSDLNFLYGPEMPKVVCGVKYYVQVRIKSTGEIPEDVNPYFEFANNGFSNLALFECNDDCIAPEVLEAEAISNSEMLIKWQGWLNHDPWIIAYRLLSAGGEWSTVTTDIDSIVISDLKTSDIYEFKVGGICNDIDTVYSPLDTLELPGSDYSNEHYECGIPLDEFDLANMVPLPTLVQDDTIFAGDFKVIVTSANGGNGSFSGLGYIFVPYFNLARVNVVFTAITVNDEYRMVSGTMVVTGIGADLLSGEFEDILDSVLTGLEEVSEVLGEIGAVLSTIGDALDASENVNDYFSDGWNVLNDPQDIQNEYPYLPDSLITQLEDAIDCFETQPANICQQQLDSAIVNLQSALDSMFDASLQIVFEENTDQIYGTDQRKSTTNEVFKDNYNNFTIADEPYSVTWKSVKSQTSDEINAKRKGGGLIPANIRFEDNLQVPVPVVILPDDVRKITVQGGLNEEVKQIYAVESTPAEGGGEEIHLAGKLNVISYDQIPLNVVMIPVNQAWFPYDSISFKAEVQEIFDPAVVDVNITFHEGINIDGFNGTMDDASSGFLSNYTDQMKNIAGEFKDQMEEEVYYLFMVNTNANTQKLGFMPRGKSSGFIYNAPHGSMEQYAHTVAHELGHGAYVLEHTFATHDELQPGDTDNLMDYGNGNTLLKYQWDFIHDPVTHWALFDDDDEGEYIDVDADQIPESYLNPDDSTFTFVTPAGLPITVPKEISAVAFYSGDQAANSDFQIALFGSLYYFKLEDTLYIPSIYDGIFAGYVGSDSGLKYKDKYTPTFFEEGFDLTTIKPIVGFPCFDPDEHEVIFGLGKLDLNTPSNPPPNTGIPPDLGITSLPPGGFSVNGNYLGSGFYDPYDKLVSDDFYDQTQIEAKMYWPNSNLYETMEFLKRIEGASSCDAQVFMYAFTHAHQINKYPGFYTRCEGTFPADPELKLSDFYDELEEAQYVYQDFENDIFTSFKALEGKSKEEMDAWAAKKTSAYRLYFEMHQEFEGNLIDSYPEYDYPGVPLSDREYYAKQLFDQLYIFKDNACAFLDLTLARRIKILKLLTLLEMEEPNWYEFGIFREEDQDQEHLYTLILATTPLNETQAVLDIFTANDNALFYKVANKLNDNSFLGMSDKHGYESFVSIITLMHNKVQTWEGNCDAIDSNGFRLCNLCSQPEQVSQILGLNNIFDKNADKYPTSTNYIADGKIRLISAKKIKVGEDDEGEPIHEGIDRISTGSPLDYVGIVFDYQAKFTLDAQNQIIVNEGDILVVTYAFADYLFRKKASAEFQLATRLMFDAVAIGLLPLAPVGGGVLATSLRFLAYADAVYGAFDAFVMAGDYFELDVTGYSNISQELHQSWNEAGMVLALANGAGFLTVLGNGMLRFTISKTQQLYRNLAQSSNPDPNTQKFIDLMIETRTKMRSLTPPSGADEFAKWQSMLKHMDAEIAAMELTRRSAATELVAEASDLTFKVSKYDLEVYIKYKSIGGTTTDLAAGQIIYVDDVPYFKPNSISTVNDGEHIATLYNVRYLDDLDQPKMGTFELRFKNGAYFLREALEINWTNNITGFNSTKSAMWFWEQTGPNMTVLYQGDFVIKHDVVSGYMVFGNAKTGKFLGFFEGAENVNIINGTATNSFGSNSELFSRLSRYFGQCAGSGCNLSVPLSSGANIVRTPGKTGNIIGNYNQGDMEAVISELIKGLRTQQFGPNPGGYRVLSVSDNAVSNWDTFWDDFNKIWLQNAIDRAVANGDEIFWAATDPNNLPLVFKNPTGLPPFGTVDNMLDYIKTVPYDQLRGYGQEIKLLAENNFAYVASKGQFIRKIDILNDLIKDFSAVKSWVGTLDEAKQLRIYDEIRHFDNAKLASLETDIGNSAFKTAIADNPDLLKGWEVLDGSTLGSASKTDPEVLARMLDDITENSSLKTFLLASEDNMDLWLKVKWGTDMSSEADFIKVWKNIVAGQKINHVYHGDVVLTIKRTGFPDFQKKYKATYFLDSNPGSGGLVDDLGDIQNMLQSNTDLVDNIKHNLKSNQLNKETDVIHFKLTGLHGGHYLDPANANIFGQPGVSVTYLERPVVPPNTAYNPSLSPVVTTSTIVSTPKGQITPDAKLFEVAPATTRVFSSDGFTHIMNNGTLPDLSDANNLFWLKKGNNSAGMASIYPTGLPASEVEELVAMAFSRTTKTWGTGTNANAWESVITVKGKQVTFSGYGVKGSGGVDTDVFNTGYITNVSP